ncbi:MAG: metallophosphoesterase [Paludibacteraceae bacterium]|nr:metallophosphoesterase [Paludibacteraceae bacterium]
MVNIIGDIHGLDRWKQLVREDAANIFVGDYFDSKDGRSQEEIVANFKDIIAFKQKHPETVLLYGNHDLNYLLDKDYKSRFSHPEYRENYRQLFAETEALFYGVAYAIDEKTLVSHAGVTKEWYEKQFGVYRGESPQEVAKQINDLWQRDKTAFTFNSNVTVDPDVYGVSPAHSPLWIRSWILPEHNLFADTPVTQIIGHTPKEDITFVTDRILCVDCLLHNPKSWIIE